jgi:predicted nucleotide-binding protein (sugar kinase/HSP70/actin superfamily)
MEARLKKASEESIEMAKRMNDVVKKIKKVDTSKVVLTSKPYRNKEKVLSK